MNEYDEHRKDTLFRVLVIVLLILTGFQTWLILSRELREEPPTQPGFGITEPGNQSVLPIPGAIGDAEKLQNAFAAVADRAVPAVVIVRTSQKIRYYVTPNIRGGRFPWQSGRGKIVEQEQVSGQASGFIVRDDGYVVTNYHVVRDQSRLDVVLHNGKEYPAKVVGVDPLVDLAVLKIEPETRLPFLSFADSNQVKVGHWAIVVGAPFTLNYTVTAGIVSHKGRAVGMNVLENYIQTDAAINPGNSGGPLLNLHGDVIGISDFIFTPPGNQGCVGLSFAIASNLASNVVEQLIQEGKVKRTWLGIVMQNLDPGEAAKLGIEDGVVVIEARAGEPADKAGIRAGDIILSIDGRDIDNFQEIRQAILEHKPGDTVRVTVFRNGKTLEIPVLTDKE